MIKKIIALLIVSLVFILGCGNVFASGENLMQNPDFEAQENIWENGIITSEKFSGGAGGLKIHNPISSASPVGVPHVAEYIPEVSLEEGCLYTLSFFVCTDDEINLPSAPKADIHFASASNRITCTVSDISSEWSYVSGLFVAGQSSEYGLSLILFSMSETASVYIDDISLVKMTYIPSSIRIEGARSVYIPESGATSYTYTGATVDKNGNVIPIITGNLKAVDPLPDGVLFDSKSGTLMVESYAEPDAVVTIKCTPPEGSSGLPEGVISVVLNKNVVINGDFESFPQMLYWNDDSSLTAVSDENGNYAKVQMKSYDEMYYGATILPDSTFVLEADTMYVFRAKVKSAEGFLTKAVLSPNALVDDRGVININISDVGGSEWTEVVSVIQTHSKGIYQVKINISCPDDRPVFIDDIRISIEQPMSTDVIFNIPGRISIGDSANIPINYAVRDQGENIISDDAQISVYPSDTGVSIQGKTLFVSSGAQPGTYTVKGVAADNPLAAGKSEIILSNETIGDGSFEISPSGLLWATSHPSEFKIGSIYADFRPADGKLMGRLTMNGSVSVLYSNSVKVYAEGKSYIFNGYMAKMVPDIETVVTAMVVDVQSTTLEDTLVIGQFTLSDLYKNYQVVFTPSVTVAGRLMLAFTTPEQHDSQIVVLDKIEIPDAKVYANDVRISGEPYPEMLLTGKYKFGTNFETNDTSTFRWLMSSEENGVYMPMAGQTGQTLSVTPDMIDKYIKFEVTPISLDGPVVGASVATGSVKIGYPISDEGHADPAIPEGTGNETDTPIEPSAQPEQPVQPVQPENPIIQRGEISIVNLNAYVNAASKVFFADTQNHWAHGDINLMVAAGIANGRGDGLFSPSEAITRAEFSAFLIRAFRLAPLYYEQGFNDVKPWNWYAGVVETATKYGFTQGMGDGIFAPDLPVTREQMAVMIVRACNKAGIPLPAGGAISFGDSYYISSWAREDVSKATAAGLIKGTDKGNFEPQKNATRAEAITVIKRMIELISNQP